MQPALKLQMVTKTAVQSVFSNVGLTGFEPATT
jgi:ABC-type thiamine transport system ATPase subunit